MNDVYQLLPTFIPSELCDKIYLFLGIRTPSCVCIVQTIMDLHRSNRFLNRTDTFWSFHVRDVSPIALRSRPTGTWKNEIDLDICIAYHHTMINYWNHLLLIARSKENIDELEYIVDELAYIKSNLWFHNDMINYTFSCENTRITKRLSLPYK